MRKKFVYFVLVPALVILLILYVFIDQWVASGLELAGEKIARAKVEIDQLHLSLSPLGIRWSRMQVADQHDPWRNLFETGNVQVAMNFGQLLRGKFIIESVEVSDLILGSKRTTDGSIPVEPKPPGSDSTFESAARSAVPGTESSSIPAIPSPGKVNIDSLVKMAGLQSLGAIDSLKAQTLSASKQWDASLADLKNSETRLTEVGNDIKNINPSQIKGADQILAAITTVDKDVKAVKDISDNVSNRTSAIQADVSKLSSSVSGLDQVVTRDFQHLMSMANLSSLDAAGIAKMLLGKAMVDRVAGYLHYADVARSMIRKHSPPEKDPDPPRMKGQNIQFPVERAYPKFWIQKIHLSGGTDSSLHSDFVRASGDVNDITDDQSVTRKPTVAKLAGSQAGKRAMTLSALFDRTKDVPFDQYTVTLDGVPLSEFPLGNQNFLPARITDARMDTRVDVEIPGNQFDVHVDIGLTDFHLTFQSEPKGTIEGIVRNVLSGVNRFNAGIRMWKRNDAVDVAFSTDLDDQITARLKGVVGEQLTKLQGDLRKKLDERIGPKRKELEDLLAGKSDVVNKQIASVRGLVDQQTSALNGKKKELTDRLEAEKQGKLKDALKGILKR